MQKFKDQIDEKYFNFYKIFINRNFQTPIKASNIWQNALSYIQLTSASFPSSCTAGEKNFKDNKNKVSTLQKINKNEYIYRTVQSENDVSDMLL